MTDIDQVIGQVTNLYRAVTGREAPPADTVYAPIPAERDPMQHVQEQLARLLETLGASPTPVPNWTWAPALSMWENGSEVVFCLDLPGVRRERLEVNVQGNLLIVSGERPTLVANGYQFRYGEAPSGPFRRVVPLPPGVRTSELIAQFRDGVLEIRVPRESPVAMTSRVVPVA